PPAHIAGAQRSPQPESISHCRKERGAQRQPQVDRDKLRDSVRHVFVLSKLKTETADAWLQFHRGIRLGIPRTVRTHDQQQRTNRCRSTSSTLNGRSALTPRSSAP